MEPLDSFLVFLAAIGALGYLLLHLFAIGLVAYLIYLFWKFIAAMILIGVVIALIFTSIAVLAT